MNWSDYQNTIFKLVAGADQSLLIEAAPGSGKTTTLVEAANRTPTADNGIVLAFNSAIAKELRSKVPARRFEARTVHSLGYKALCAEYGFGLAVVQAKAWNDAQDLAPNSPWPVRRAAVKLVGAVKQTRETTLPEFRAYSLMATCDIRTPRPKQSIELAQEMLRRTLTAPPEAVDFNDMCWLPAVTGLSMPQYDWVFVDELQDLNALQIELVLRSLDRGSGLLVAAGDPRQSIYEFRGAMQDAFGYTRQELGRLGIRSTNAPLSVSYRCPRAVIDYANSLMTGGAPIEPCEDARDGSVTPQSRLDGPSMQPGDFVLARTHAEVLDAMLATRNLLPKGVRGYLKDQRVLDDVQSWLDDLTGRSSAAILRSAEADLEAEEASLGEAAKGRERPARVACLEVLCRYCPERDAIERALAGMRREKPGKNDVHFMTAHAAKGLEADRVWVLAEGFGGHEGLPREDENLYYVAVTRAREALYLVE